MTLGTNETSVLFELFFKFSDAFLGAARSSVGTGKMPNRIEHRFVFDDPGFSTATGSAIRYETIEVPDFRDFLLMNRERWGGKGAELCAREHFESGVSRPRQAFSRDWSEIAIPKFEDLKNQLVHETYYAVATLCERLQDLSPTRANLFDAYQLLIEHWTLPTVNWELIAPLADFSTDHRELSSITKMIELAPFSHAEKTLIWNQGGSFGPFGEPPTMSRDEFARATYALRCERTSRRDDPGFELEPDNEIMRFISALRLLKPGDVRAAAIFGRSEGLVERFSSQFLEGGRLPKVGLPYILEGSDFPLLRKILEAFDTGATTVLQVPLRRFNQGYARRAPEDRLIDLTIALESCLLGGIRGELRYRLATRGAVLLASQRDPLETRQLLEAVYDVRSQIVHNGKQFLDKSVQHRLLRLEQEDRKDFVGACESVTRDVLRECALRLIAGESVEEFGKRLDDELLIAVLGAVNES